MTPLATCDARDAARDTWDVAVIGAGPAGALAAMLTAARGARTILIERATFPRPKVCGGCLGAGAVKALASIGLSDVLDRVCESDLERIAMARHATQIELALPRGRVVRRDRFDQALAGAALDAGADLLTGASVVACEASTDTGTRIVTVRTAAEDHHVRARCVVVAAGLGADRLLPAAERAVRISRGSKIGLGAMFEGARQPAGVIHMCVGASGYVGTVRAGNSLIVGAAVSPAMLRRYGGPEIAVNTIRQDAGMAPLSFPPGRSLKGTPRLTQRRVIPAAWRVFFIGDGAGYVEPFTGEGMTWAIQSAIGVAPLAARRWDDRLMDAWRRWYGREVAPRQRACRAMGVVLGSPTLSSMAMGLTHMSPAVAASVARRMHGVAPGQGG